MTAEGQLDTELASEGLAQARIAGRYLRPRNFDMAFTSDLKRANLVRAPGSAASSMLSASH